MSTENKNSDENLLSTEGQSIRGQMTGMAAWLTQLGIIWLASIFRYSYEPGGWISEHISRPGPVPWKPFIFSWIGLPLSVAGAVIAVWLIWHRRNTETKVADIGQVGTLLTLSAFALSGGSSSMVLPALIAIWLCFSVGIAAHHNPGREEFTLAASVILLFSCMFGALMQIQTFCTPVEFSLIFFSFICGIASSGWRPNEEQLQKVAIPAWFSLLLLLSANAPGIEHSIRTLVMLEISAAFIAGHRVDILLKKAVAISTETCEALNEPEEAA